MTAAPTVTVHVPNRRRTRQGRAGPIAVRACSFETDHERREGGGVDHRNFLLAASARASHQAEPTSNTCSNVINLPAA